MKSLVRFLFGLALLTSCAKQQSPDMATAHEQEGIGGDLAAFYAKSVTAASLHARIVDYPEQFDDTEAKLRDTPVFSAPKLGRLVVYRDGALWVDRRRIRTAHTCEISRAYLRALGKSDDERDVCYRVETALEKVRGKNWSLGLILQKLSDYQPHRLTDARFIRSPFTFDLALQSIPGMEEAMRTTQISRTPYAVYDRADGLRNGTESVRVDTITYRNKRIIKMDQGRLEELPELSPFLPVFMLHELNHVANPNELPDRKYALSQELFTMWLNL